MWILSCNIVFVYAINLISVAFNKVGTGINDSIAKIIEVTATLAVGDNTVNKRRGATTAFAPILIEDSPTRLSPVFTEGTVSDAKGVSVKIPPPS